MNNHSKIRWAKQRDLESLTKLCQLHANFEKSAYNPKGKIERLYKHIFSDNPSLYCLVVEKDNNLIGYATFMKQFSTWDADYYVYMDCLFLTEESRGLGIGENLIERIKEESSKLGCALIQWQTPDFNKRAMKFYKRIGAVGKSKERYFLNVQCQ